MDATTVIKKFQEFLETCYYSELAEKIRIGDNYLNVSFSELTKFSPEVADELLENLKK
jgi:hypothetical protein